MNKTRVIPILLLEREGLVKTVKFKNSTYIGDPINSVRIFNEKEVDELVFLDISASRKKDSEPNYELLADIASEAFMPMAYGGGLKSIDQIKQIFAIGFEKVIINSAAYTTPQLISEAASIYGSQSVVGGVDVKRNFFGGPDLFSESGQNKSKTKLLDHIRALVDLGIGELLVNSIDRDGTFTGYDLNLLRAVTAEVAVPVIACGGAAGIEDFVAGVDEGGVSAVAAGSAFVFVGPHRAVLINYPDRKDMSEFLP